MSESQFLSYLPEWQGAKEIADEVGYEQLALAAGRLVDLVLAEDSIVLDSLPADLESSVIAPLEMLGQVLEDNRSLIELVVAARLVRRTAMPYLGCAPEEVAALIRALPE